MLSKVLDPLNGMNAVQGTSSFETPYIDIPPEGFTLGVWVKLATTLEDGTLFWILAKVDGEDKEARFWYTIDVSGDITFKLSFTGYDDITFPVVNYGTIYKHYSLAFYPDWVTLYIQGALKFVEPETRTYWGSGTFKVKFPANNSIFDLMIHARKLSGSSIGYYVGNLGTVLPPE